MYTVQGFQTSGFAISPFYTLTCGLVKWFSELVESITPIAITCTTGNHNKMLLMLSHNDGFTYRGGLISETPAELKPSKLT